MKKLNDVYFLVITAVAIALVYVFTAFVNIRLPIAANGGQATLYTSDYKNEIDVSALQTYLEHHHDFKYATVVHCDTPSGIRNNVEDVRLTLAALDETLAHFGFALKASLQETFEREIGAV